MQRSRRSLRRRAEPAPRTSRSPSMVTARDKRDRPPTAVSDLECSWLWWWWWWWGEGEGGEGGGGEKRRGVQTIENSPSLSRVEPALLFGLLAPFPILFSSSLPSSLDQQLRKCSSDIALYSPMASPSSLGNAPFSLRIFSLATFHSPFCAIKPYISNLFRSL